MELVDGRTLRELLAGGPLPIKKTLHLAAQVADGLAKAHAAGIVHRDLKPENLMVTRDGLAKILDFGLAKLTQPAPGSEGSQATTAAEGTEPGAIVGTAGYMSPEQANGLAVDFRSDQFSFGAILYEMVTGKRAFQRGTRLETLSAIVRDEPEPITAVNPNVPAPLGWTVERCLAKSAEDRYASTRDLARELQTLREHVSEVSSRDASPAPRPPVTASKHLRAFVVIGVALGVLGALIGGFFLGRSRREPLPTFQRLTFGHGNVTGARFAADGQNVIYGAAWVGKGPEIYTTRPGNPESRSLGLTNAAGIWSVSSTGEMAIAFPCTLSWALCMGTLALVPPAGGAPRPILENVHEADWAPDGQLAVAQFTGGRDGRDTVQYPIGKVLYEAPAWVTYVRVSPKGDRIAFLDHPILGARSGSVSVVDLAGKKTTLSTGWKIVSSLAWSPSGEEVWFAGSRTIGASHALHAVTLSGRERMVLPPSGEALYISDISRDAKRVLLFRGIGRASIIALAPGDSKERDLSWFDSSTAADLSSDGKTVLLYEWGGTVGDFTVYLRKTDGSDAVRLGGGKPLALSPDGKWALALQQAAPQQLILLPTGPGAQKALPRGPIGEFLHWAAWSPDGGRIFFSAQEPGHRPRTYVEDIQGGLPQPVTPEGMVGTLLSPDAKLIAAVGRYNEYYLCPVGGGKLQPLEGYEDGDVPLQWSSDRRSLFLRAAGDMEIKIYKLDLESGRRELWKELRPPYPAGVIDVSSDPGQVRLTPDGKAYVYTFWTFVSNLYLVEGLK
jgi:WD40 repeat protein